MTAAHKQLLFSDVDGLAFAALRGRLDKALLRPTYETRQLGPLLELLHLSAGGQLPHLKSWLSLTDTGPLVAALEQGKKVWVSQADRRVGFIRATRNSHSSTRLTSFLMKAKRAGREISGLPQSVSGQLVAAMEELENNIHEHAEAPETGIIAYQAEPSVFEFVVADHGIGILHSLRQCPAYAALRDDGRALLAALRDGVSRHGSGINHGYGFRQIFTGLVNLRGELRFRSGDHAVTMDGIKPEVATAKTAQKTPIDGFFASVRCHANPK